MPLYKGGKKKCGLISQEKEPPRETCETNSSVSSVFLETFSSRRLETQRHLTSFLLVSECV